MEFPRLGSLTWTGRLMSRWRLAAVDLTINATISGKTMTLNLGLTRAPFACRLVCQLSFPSSRPPLPRARGPITT